MLSLRSRLERVRAEQAGFTLIELLVAIGIGMVVLVGILTLLDSSARSAGRTFDRADVTQRGRTAMNAITQPMRSQVCKDNVTPPVIAGDASSVTFYTDTDTSEAFVPVVVRIFFDSTWKGGRGAIREYVYPGTDTTAIPTQRVLLEDVSLVPGSSFLTYYSFDGTTAMSTPLSSTITNTDNSALPANSIAKVLRTDIAFRAAPSVATNKTGALSGNQLDALRDSDFTSSVYVRNSDYTDQAAANNDRIWGPRCS